MTQFFAARQRLVDLVAIAVVGGATVGVIVLLALAPAPTEAEWQRLIGATMIASPAPSVDISTPPAADREPSVL